VGYSLDGHQYIYVAARRGLLQCFDVTGTRPTQVWQYQMPHEVFGSPVITDTGPSSTMLFLGSKYGNVVAIDARTGKAVWQKMAGNWVDNTGCVGEINGEKVVFFGSHDYHVYAFKAKTGELMWKRAVGGEVYSAPCFLKMKGKPYVTVSALDNHLYLIDGENGRIVTSFFTGNPIWDKLTKGENLWGSSGVVAAEENSVIVHGSFNDVVYVLPMAKECSLTAVAYSQKSLWWGLLAVFLLFCCVVLPAVLLAK
jgi:outer membrane protein assembly factor BamB